MVCSSQRILLAAIDLRLTIGRGAYQHTSPAMERLELSVQLVRYLSADQLDSRTVRPNTPAFFEIR